MKNLLLKALILIFTACSMAIASMAQLRTPENIPINVCGRVIDQDSLPVQGAKVVVNVIISHFAEDGTEQKSMNVETDNSGNFLITAPEGHAIDFSSVEKKGYELSKKSVLTFTHSFLTEVHPDSSNPVIVRMWRKQGQEHLVSAHWHGMVGCDTTVHRFDLTRGSSSSDGDLEIVCARTPSTLPPASRRPFDFKFQVTIVGGGILVAQDEFRYRAPENGYVSALTFEQKADDPKWSGKLPQEFYIKTADGHYGALTVDWGDGFRKPPLPLKWDCWINPSGSQNLER